MYNDLIASLSLLYPIKYLNQSFLHSYGFSLETNILLTSISSILNILLLL